MEKCHCSTLRGVLSMFNESTIYKLPLRGHMLEFGDDEKQLPDSWPAVQPHQHCQSCESSTFCHCSVCQPVMSVDHDALGSTLLEHTFKTKIWQLFDWAFRKLFYEYKLSFAAQFLLKRTFQLCKGDKNDKYNVNCVRVTSFSPVKSLVYFRYWKLHF